MPRWTNHELQQYELRRKTNYPASRAELKQAVSHEPMGAAEGKTIYPSRLHVRVISHRKRLIDPDNLCPKYFVDCLRYAEIIPDDRAQDITLEISQEKDQTDFTVIEVSNDGA